MFTTQRRGEKCITRDSGTSKPARLEKRRGKMEIWGSRLWPNSCQGKTMKINNSAQNCILTLKYRFISKFCFFQTRKRKNPWAMRRCACKIIILRNAFIPLERNTTKNHFPFWKKSQLIKFRRQFLPRQRLERKLKKTTNNWNTESWQNPRKKKPRKLSLKVVIFSF